MLGKIMDWIVDFLTQPLLSFEKRIWVYIAMYIAAMLLPLLLMGLNTYRTRRRYK
jgi:hypothetical protein